MASRRASKKQGLLPEETAQFLCRRAVELGGILLFLAAAALAVALVTHHAGDPSINGATDRAAANLLGRPGAIVSDILLQTLGLVATLFVLAPVAWSWRIVQHRGLPRIWTQLALLPPAAVLSTLALAAVPAWQAWPFTAGLGGAVGDLCLRALLRLAAWLGFGIPAWPLALAAALLALPALAWVLGLDRRDWSRLGGGARSVGGGARAAVKGVTSLGYRYSDGLSRLEERMPRRAEPSIGKPRRERRAPPLRADRAPKAPPAPRVEPAPKAARKNRRAQAEAQPTLGFLGPDGYRLPPLDIIAKPAKADRIIHMNEESLEQNARLLESVLDDFGVKGQIVHVRPGPVVTLYELEPAPGTKSARVIGLADDIARSMSAVSARVAVVPGRNAIGIELPNQKRQMVALRELLEAPEYERANSQLTLILGKDIGGAPIMADLATMPHLLVAGTTGSGKSVALNTMILSFLYRLPPNECKLIMIDPKMLELSVYEGIPHLLTPVVTDPRKAVVALKWAVKEMEDRYRAMSTLGVRNLKAYNQQVMEAAARGETVTRTVQTGFDAETGRPIYETQNLDLKPLPKIVIIVDEMADLMIVAGKEVEGSIQRLAQMARAAGVHLIMATQRPSVDVITGTIKANFPTRISFQVTSKIDSRTILGEQGAEQLLGQGDMLYMAGGGRITRVHGPFVSDKEVEDVVTFLKSQGAPEYIDEVTADPDEEAEFGMDGGGTGDDLYDRAVALVAAEGKASTSFVQRHLQIGYNRAARIIEQMEKEGVVSEANHVGKREVLIGQR